MDLINISVCETPNDVREWCEKNSVGTAYRFCSYIQYIDGEMVVRIFGTRKYKKLGVKIGEVMRHSTGDSSTIIKNLSLSSIFF